MRTCTAHFIQFHGDQIEAEAIIERERYIASPEGPCHSSVFSAGGDATSRCKCIHRHLRGSTGTRADVRERRQSDSGSGWDESRVGSVALRHHGGT